MASFALKPEIIELIFEKMTKKYNTYLIGQTYVLTNGGQGQSR